MHSLLNLSDECLSLILAHDPASVISLMQCGCPSLKNRIFRTCKSFSTPKGLIQAYKWPRLLAELPHLESVHFEAQVMRENLEHVASEVKRLSKSLKRLTILLPKASYILLSKFSTQPGSLEIIAHHTPISSPISSLWNVSQYFPLLEELDLHFEGQGADFRLRGVDLSIFPETLRALNLINIHLPFSDFSHLPRELKSLSISSVAPTVNDLLSLPPCLTSLSGVKQMPSHGLKHLPKTLTSGIDCYDMNFTEAQTLASLPPGLRYFALYPGHMPKAQDYLTILPMSLTDLTLSLSASVQISRFPPTITRIRSLTLVFVLLNMSLLSESEADTFWPPHLKTLEVDASQTNTPPTLLSRLPASLTCLRHLSLAVTQQSSVFELASSLPPNLIELSVYATPGSSDWAYKVTPLPSSLKVLKMLEKDVGALQPEVELGAIPCTLTEFEAQVLTESYFAKLPRALKTLKIASIEGKITEKGLKALPPHLESLEIATGSESLIDVQALGLLPQTLFSLKLSKLPMAALKYLPTSIRRFSAEIVAPTSNFDASGIPLRWLRWLSYNASHCWLDKILPQWPVGESLPAPLRTLTFETQIKTAAED